MLNKRDRVVQECTKCEESAAKRPGKHKREKKGVRGVGGVIKKALDEARTSRLCSSSFVFFFYIYIMYVFFYQQRNV